MFRKPLWRGDDRFHDPSPFKRGTRERRLKITIHAPAPVPPSDVEPLALLREIVQLEEVIEFIDTSPGSTHQIATVPEDRAEEFNINHSYEHRDSTGRVTGSCAGPFNWWVEDVQAHRPEHRDQDSWWSDIHAAGASDMLGHDLLATTSTALIETREKRHLAEMNICSIQEALRIVGLFLRSRDCFVYAVGQASFAVDGWSFYGRMAKARLPQMSPRSRRWFDTRESPISQLRGSVGGRCRRALEARDAIGIQFYLRNDHRSEESAQYHFDYLTLLLSGALDAVMHIVNTAYAIGEHDWNVGLWRKEFRKAVKVKAPAIAAVLDRSDVLALRHLLTAPRNTIHAEQLRSISYSKDARARVGLIKLGQEMGHKALEASVILGGPERWGIVRMPELPIEPYTYASALIDVCFPLLCELLQVVEATLFGPVVNDEQLPDPDPEQLRRIGLLA